MSFVSTRGEAPPAGLREALFRGLAPDGGLYVPERLEPLPREVLEGLPGSSFPETALAVARHLVGETVGDALDGIIRRALDFPVPLVRLAGEETGEGAAPEGSGPGGGAPGGADAEVRILELFHGPTLAFKDVGARVMARLMGHFHDPADGTLTILVATSGDTGSAVAHAFLDVPGTRTVVLYPRGRVSPVQERQFTTLGGNVRAVAVEGGFDDCQRLAKEAFADAGLREEVLLTSANSINVGRLLPQAFYHVHAWATLAGEGSAPLPGEGGSAGGSGDAPPEPVFSVPSGNFGNLTAGLVAKRLGVPVRRFVAATNTNDVVPRYLETGRYEPRASESTLSSAMDVGDPSNFRRILHLYGGDRDALGADVLGSAHDDGETRAAIREAEARHGRLLDPHTAVGWLGLRAAREEHPRAPGVVLATAHPAKFPDVVEEETGRRIPVPHRLARALEGTPRSTGIPPRIEPLKKILRGP